MTIGIPCNPCDHNTCGNCVADKLKTMGFIDSAKYHCSCANNGHTNSISKDLPNKSVFSSKRDTEPAHHGGVQDNSDDFEDVD